MFVFYLPRLYNQYVLSATCRAYFRMPLYGQIFHSKNKHLFQDLTDTRAAEMLWDGGRGGGGGFIGGLGVLLQGGVGWQVGGLVLWVWRW